MLCEAARAIAPATTSCAGFWSGCGGGGGGAATTVVGAGAAEGVATSLPAACGGREREQRGAQGEAGAAQRGARRMRHDRVPRGRALTCPRFPGGAASALLSTMVSPAPVAAVTTPCSHAHRHELGAPGQQRGIPLRMPATGQLTQPNPPCAQARGGQGGWPPNPSWQHGQGDAPPPHPAALRRPWCGIMRPQHGPGLRCGRWRPEFETRGHRCRTWVRLANTTGRWRRGAASSC